MVRRWLRITASVACALLLAAAAVHAEDAAESSAEVSAGKGPATEAEGPNLGALSVAFDNSFTTAYMFRGILNVRDGLIWQPSIELSLSLFEREDGVLRSVDVGFGTWGSYQTHEIGGDPESDGLYEVDYYPSLSLTWAGGISSAVTYYFYTSPNGFFDTVEEVTVDLSYDDSELLGAFSVSPTATFAFETKRSSLGGGKGAVVVLGIEPGYTFLEDGDWPLDLTVPVTLALSLDDYYRDGSDDDVFGYATVGLHLSVPVGCIPPRFGSWSVTNGFDVFFLNDVLEAINEDDQVYPVWTSSITLEY